MIKVSNQPLEVHLFVGVLGLADQHMPICIDEPVEMGVVVESGHDEPFVAAVGLVVDVGTGLIRLFVEQPVEGGQATGILQKSEAVGIEKTADFVADRGQVGRGADFVPEIEPLGELADGDDEGIGIGAEIDQVVEKLLGDLLYLLVAAAEINFEQRLAVVE